MPSPGLIQMQFLGGPELAAALRELGADPLIKATMRRALLDVARPIADVAALLAPVGRETGKPHLKAKIIASTQLSARQRRGRARSGPNEAFVFIGSGPRGPGVLVEFGTGPRRQRTNHPGARGHGGSHPGKSTGQMRPHPFLRPAWEGGKDRALDDFGKALWRQIARSAERLARRQARLIAAGR